MPGSTACAPSAAFRMGVTLTGGTDDSGPPDRSVGERHAARARGEERLVLLRRRSARSERGRLVGAVVVAGPGDDQAELVGQPPQVRALVGGVVWVVDLQPEQPR